MRLIHGKKLTIALLVLALACITGAMGWAEEYEATSMRLLHYEGEVEILDDRGNPRFVVEDVRFSSGEAMLTGADSSASVGLDDSKILTLGADSRVAFIKESNYMKLTLVNGELLLDVQEKLDENETLDIQTSTMMIGIRGTIVFITDGVAQDPTAGQEAPRVTTLHVLEGTAQAKYTDDNGDSWALAVGAGQKAMLTDANGNGQADAAPEVSDITAEDMAGLVDRQMENDPKLKKRINEAFETSVNLNQKITLVAQSASKMFNGEPLRRTSDILVYGLPAGYTITAMASGMQINAGASENPVSSWTIYDAEGNDVTSLFSNVETISGQLVVDPAPLVICTGSAQKIYDGAALTCDEVELRTVPGYERDEPQWRNASYVMSSASGAQSLYGISGSVLVHGTNPLTGETQEIELMAGQRIQVYLNNEGDQQSIELQIEDISEADIPEELLRLYADNPDLLVQACADAGWNQERIEWMIGELEESDEKKVRQEDLTITEDNADRLMLNFTNVRINIDSEITSYNNRALGSEETIYTPVKLDESIKVTATGRRTQVGSSVNTYEIDWGNASPANYIISEELGTLTVLPNEAAITFTSASASKVYDGTPLENGEYTVTGLPSGFSAKAQVTGAQTDAGESQNTISAYQILNGSGVDVTTDYSNIILANGTLTVEPLALGIDLGATETAYSDSVSTPIPTVTYLNGSHAGESAELLRLAPAARPVSDVYRFALFTGDIIVVTVSGMEANAGSYTLTAQVSYPDGMEGNFDGSSVTGTSITVTPAALAITTASASKPYDGTPLTASQVTVEGLLGGDQITITATGSITDTGTVDNTYEIDWGDVNPANYEIAENIGTLTVTANGTPIVLTAVSAEKDYDGKSLTAGEVTAEGLPEGITFTAEVRGSQTDAGESENKIVSYAILDEDGNDVTASFTDIEAKNGTLMVAPAALTVTTESAEKAYDGEALTAPASIAGLAPDEAVTVTATGAITDVGETDNTYEIDWGNVNPANYEIAENIGTLTVTANGMPITLTAASAEKVYDGKALTAGEVTAEGLPAGFTYEAAATGSITDAGTAENTVASYAILDGEGKDVTAFFTDISIAAGTLTVEPAPVTIATESAEKPYDGTVLTAPATITGLINADTALVTITATGSQTIVGSAENTYEIDWGGVDQANYAVTISVGTLTVTTNDTPIVITAKSAEKNYDGTALTEYDFEVTGLPGDDTLWATGETEGSITDAGSTANRLVSYQIGDRSENDVTSYFTNVTLVDGTLTVHPQPITFDLNGYSIPFNNHINIPVEAYGTDGDGNTLEMLDYDSDWTVYGNAPYSVTCTFALIGDDQVTISWEDDYYSGRSIHVGSYTYTPTYSFPSGVPGNYSISFTDNIITVTPQVITITMQSESIVPTESTYRAKIDVYCESENWYVSGTDTGYNVGGFLNVNTITEVSPGEIPLTCTYTFEDDYSTGDFSIIVVPGTLTVVSQLEIEIDLGGGDYAYSAKTATPVLTYRNTDRAGQTATASLVSSNEGTDIYSISLYTGDTVTLTVSRPEAAPSAAYQLTADCTFSDYPNSYSVSYTNAGVTIHPLEVGYYLGVYQGGGQWEPEAVYGDRFAPVLVLSWGMSELSYSGTTSPTIYGTYTKSFTNPYVETDQWRLILSDSMPNADDVGVHVITASVEMISGDGSNYNFTFSGSPFEYTILPRPITITTTSAEKTYDGTPMVGEVTVENLVGKSGATEPVFTTSTLTDAGSITNEYTVEWNDYDPSHYEITEELGTLTVTPLDMQIRIKDAVVPFDMAYHQVEYEIACDAEYTVNDAVFNPYVQVAGSMFQLIFSPSNIKNAGSWDATCTVNWAYGDQNNFNITVADGSLTVTPVPVTVTTGSASKVYDGTPLTAPASITGFTCGESVYITATGTITDAGSETNTYSIDWNGWEPENYEVTENLGTLTVTPLDVELEMVGGEFVYDGTSHKAHLEVHTAAPYTLTGDPSSNYVISIFGIDITAGCGYYSTTQVNTMTPSINVYTYSKDGAVNAGLAGNFNITKKSGTLAVAPLRLQFDLGGKTVTYNGGPASYGDPVLKYLNGSHTGETVTAATINREIGATIATFDLFPGESVTLTAVGYPYKDAGEYPLTGSCEFSEHAYDYDISYTNDLCVVQPTPITVTTASETKVFDGTPLPESTAAPITGTLYDPYTYATVTGYQKDAGSSTNTYEMHWDGNPGNYTVAENLGTLTVEPLEVEFDLGGGSYTPIYYDGEFHGGGFMAYSNYEGYSVVQNDSTHWRLAWDFGDIVDVTVTGGGTEVGDYPLTCSYTFVSGKESNYSISITGETLQIINH